MRRVKAIDILLSVCLLIGTGIKSLEAFIDVRSVIL